MNVQWVVAHLVGVSWYGYKHQILGRITVIWVGLYSIGGDSLPMFASQAQVDALIKNVTGSNIRTEDVPLVFTRYVYGLQQDTDSSITRGAAR